MKKLTILLLLCLFAGCKAQPTVHSRPSGDVGSVSEITSPSDIPPDRLLVEDEDGNWGKASIIYKEFREKEIPRIEAERESQLRLIQEAYDFDSIREKHGEAGVLEARKRRDDHTRRINESCDQQIREIEEIISETHRWTLDQGLVDDSPGN